MSDTEKQPKDASPKNAQTPKKRGRFRSSMRSVFGRGGKSKNEDSNQSKISGKESSSSVSRKSSSEAVAVCPVCYVVKPQSLFPDISTCEHRTCGDCLRQYMSIEINESRVNLTCPECSERFHPNDIRFVLNDEALMNKYREFTLRRTLVSDPDCRWCPAPDCGYAVIAAGCASCPKLTCEREKCKTEFCYHCKQIWHPNLTCDMARQRRASNIRSLPMNDSKSLSGEDMKPCPRCGAFIIKLDDGTCNHMTCAVCGAEFCWLCMKEISDLHYLSPSGCTFWGKKPWSRKKKILWQMGTLIGAPLGIALAAGVVLPAMVIGIPVYVGRQMHEKYNRPYHTKKKRNIAIVSGVTLSILVSPMLAALTVGVGVPIALGYIYGVVPISLCRSGGCASVTTLKNGRGVNLEFDSDADMVTNPNGNSTVGIEAGSTAEENIDGVVTVVATVNTRAPDSESGKQPSVSLSQECSSLASSNIEASGRDDTGSMIPGPRSCAVSIASSIENLNITTTDNPPRAPSPSLTGVSSETGEQDRVSTSSSKTPSESSLKKVVQLKVASDASAVEVVDQPTIVAES